MKRILLGMVLCFLSPALFGQFQPSSLGEQFIVGSDLSGHIRHTNCHSSGNADFSDFSSDLYASTWGEGGSQLHYKRTHANYPGNVIYEGTILIPNAAIIHDVAIVSHPDINSPNKYCVAAIFSDNFSGGSIAFYEWTLTGLSPLYNFPFTGNYTYNMSIDAISLSSFVVVYESGNRLYSFAGMTPFINPFGYPFIGPVVELQTNGSNMKGMLPDVALTQLPFLPNNPTGIKVYYTYIDEIREHCYVSYLGYDELFWTPSPIMLNYEHMVNQMPYIFSGSTNCLPGTPFPRFFYSPGPKIDAPDRSEDSWAVIAGQHEFYPNLNNNGTNTCPWPVNMNKMMQLQMTAAYKHNGGPAMDIVLNDGSIPGTVDMSTNLSEPFTEYLAQSQPAVAFAPEGNEINFGWGKTKEQPGLDDHDYIGLLYSAAANDVLTAPGGEAYRIIDRQPDLMPYITSIAFSGNNENTISNLYTVFTSSVYSGMYFPEGVYNKHPEWGYIPQNGYKPLNVANKDKSTPLTAYAQPNPFNQNIKLIVSSGAEQDTYEMVLRDLTGREQLRANGKLQAINRQLDQWAKGMSTANSMYLLQLKSMTTQQQTYLKITKSGM